MTFSHFALILLLLSGGQGLAQGDARRGGPEIPNPRRMPGINPHELLAQMFTSMEKLWLPAAYEQAQAVTFRASVQADLPSAGQFDARASDGGALSFDIDMDGLAAPNGRYKLDMQGGIGDVTVIKDLRRHVVVSQDFRAFSDTPKRGRSRGANLTNYRSYALRHLATVRQQILDSGVYRSVYVGTGEHDGAKVHIVRVYKPTPKRRIDHKRPIPLRKLWTFWHDGGYELWIYDSVKLPSVVFYTNVDENIFANFSIDYDRDWLPKRITFQNNSAGAEGNGDLLFTFDSNGLLSGISLKFIGSNGVDLSLTASLNFESGLREDAFRVQPPFGFRKLNRDHLKVMLMTQISGGLLKLKKHGLSLKNFKF